MAYMSKILYHICTYTVQYVLAVNIIFAQRLPDVKKLIKILCDAYLIFYCILCLSQKRFF
jgi:hypothetical protein